MKDRNNYPRLRWPLDIQYAESEGEPVAVLYDPREIAPEQAVVPALLMPIISRFDGAHSVEDIVREGSEYGVTREIVHEVIDELGRMLFLESAEATRREAKLIEEFRDAPVRKAFLAGKVYPADQSELQKRIDNYTQKRHLEGEARVAGSALKNQTLLAVVCPHVDYNRGWRTYAAAYSALVQAKRPDVVILIGTSHQASNGIFHMTNKPFETPLGRFSPAVKVIEDIAKQYGPRVFAEEILHQREHSLELQLPFLSHCYAGGRQPEIVPILVGSFHHLVTSGREPSENAEVADFVAALAESIKELRLSEQNVMVFAGVDFAHVGQHFGDSYRVSDSELDLVEARDREMLACLLKADEKGLFSHIAEDLDRRRICGFPTMYTTFSAFRSAGVSLRGHFLEYRQAVNKELDCTVSFAAAAWTEN